MFLAGINPPKQLLHLSFIGEVRAKELVEGRENMVELANELKPGFRLLSDLSLLDSFDADCAVEIGKNMSIFSRLGVGMVVRVIPDSSKDFGLNIISFFHYADHQRTATCRTMAEAAKLLSL